MIKVHTEVAKDRRDHGVAPNYPCVVIMDWVGSHLNNHDLKRVDDAARKLAKLRYTIVLRGHTYMFSLAALVAAISAMLAIRSSIQA